MARISRMWTGTPRRGLQGMSGIPIRNRDPCLRIFIREIREIRGPIPLLAARRAAHLRGIQELCHQPPTVSIHDMSFNSED